jgi:hypothetical protein
VSLQDKTQMLILLTVVVWIAWDIFVYIKKGNLPTESWTIWKWSYRIPAIAFLAGILMGHFFFQMAPPEQLAVPCVDKPFGSK